MLELKNGLTVAGKDKNNELELKECLLSADGRWYPGGISFQRRGKKSKIPVTLGFRKYKEEVL